MPDSPPSSSSGGAGRRLPAIVAGAPTTMRRPTRCGVEKKQLLLAALVPGTHTGRRRRQVGWWSLGLCLSFAMPHTTD